MSTFSFVCADCGETIEHTNENDCGGTGYGIYKEDGIEKKVCYGCCGKRDRANMIETGRATLYLVQDKPRGVWTNFAVTNWPNTLRFVVSISKVGGHNITGERRDLWFVGPDGKVWWGWNCGDNQLTHCRRLRGRSRAPGIARYVRNVG